MKSPQLPLIPPGFGQGMRHHIDAPINGAQARRVRKAKNAAARKRKTTLTTVRTP